MTMASLLMASLLIDGDLLLVTYVAVGIDSAADFKSFISRCAASNLMNKASFLSISSASITSNSSSNEQLWIRVFVLFGVRNCSMKIEK